MKTNTRTHIARPPCRAQWTAIDIATTTDPAAVTCRDCLAALERVRQAEADGTFHYTPEGVPVFQVRPEGRFRYPGRNPDGSRQYGCNLVFRCPRCRTMNRHGGEYGNPGAGDGHRAAHCGCWPDGYYLEEQRLAPTHAGRSGT